MPADLQAAAGLELAAEILEILLAQAPFNKGAGVDARGRVSLHIDQVAAVAVAPRGEAAALATR